MVSLPLALAHSLASSLDRSEMRDKDSLDEAVAGDNGELLFVECKEMREESEKP
jgi:hypothetical protein